MNSYPSSSSEPTFGVIIAGCDRDLHLVAGAVESINYFMPEVPICLIFDGKSDLSQLEKCYPLSVIRRETTKDGFLRNDSYGYGLTKMVAFWESPFEEFLYLDSDACAWGNLISRHRLNGLDMLVPCMGYGYDEALINQFFFDTNYIRQIDPGFKLLNYRKDFFCPGTLFARKGIFELDWYKYLLNQTKEDPSRFLYGDMGILNYMIFSSAQRGKINISSCGFQYVNSDSTWAKTKLDFPFKDGKPYEQHDEPVILHYAGPKPYVFNDVCSRPMRFFRLNAKQKLSPGKTKIEAMMSIFKEDFDHFSSLGYPMRAGLAGKRCAVKMARRLLRADELWLNPPLEPRVLPIPAYLTTRDN